MSDKRLSAPVFHVEEDDDYLAWKNDIEVWKMLTDVKTEKLGAAVYLAVKGKAREVLRNLKPEDLGKAGGFEAVIAALDAVYLKDETTQAYCAFKDFYEFRRSSGQGFAEFIVEYDQLYHKVKKYGMELPEGVQAFFLLKAANIASESEKLARATAKLEYKDMREKLARIFGDPGVLEEKGRAPDVKEEVLYGQDYEKKKYIGRGRSANQRNGDVGIGRGGSDGKGRWRGNSRGAYSSYKRRCFRCNSEDHILKDCPIEEANHVDAEEVNMNVHITLHLSQRSLQVEALGKGLLDSGCSRTVAGQVWYDEYLKTLSTEERANVKETESKSVFRFGDGVETKSSVCASVPVYVGKQRFLMDMEVVPNEIPLLISKGAMKQMGMQLDFLRDVATVKGDEIRLICTTTGHYCLPMNHTCIDDQSVHFVLNVQCLEGLSEREMASKALKLHRQFSHASKEKLRRLLTSGGCVNETFLKAVDKVCNECEICQKFRKAPLRPVVGFPLANDFNEVVCMDLKELNHTKLWMLHLIDAATRYSGEALVKSKRAEVIINNVFQMWIRYFGSPAKFLSDNGGEFANEQYREMNEKLGVETCKTAAESPFSNGLVERHNAILAETMFKTKADTGCDYDMALAWGVCAKNSLSNNDGFSPNQLVFSRNVNLPSILTDSLPALEPTRSSEIVRKHLEAMHSARENFVKAEASGKIRTALLRKVRSYSDGRYMNGEKVFYKRVGHKGWRGPATVIGEEGKIVLIRHGTAYYRAHPCHLMKVMKRDEEAPSGALEAPTSGRTASHAEGATDSEDDTTEFEESGSEVVDNQEEEEGEDDTVACEVPRVASEENTTGAGIKAVKARPKRNCHVEYQLDGNSVQAKVLSIQPKRGGKNGNWLNVHVDGEDTPSSVNWDDVTDWREIADTEQLLVMLTKDDELSQEVVDAKEKEILNLIENDVFEEVDDVNQRSVSCKWVMTKKIKDGKDIVKARLVARGFEENSNDARTDSPTCSRQSLRMAFIITSTMGWQIQSLDITSAFLQGNSIKRDVFLKPPEEVGTSGVLWKLKRCIYGLNDAPRAWYDRLRNELIKLDGKTSLFDEAMYLWYTNDCVIEGVIVTHVDDFVYGGSEDWHTRVVDEVTRRFKISAQFASSFKYVGLNVIQSAESVTIDQQSYIQKLMAIPISAERMKKKGDLLTQEEKSQLRSVSGQLLWATSQTRPDCAYHSCIVSNYGKEPTVNNLLIANKAIKAIKACDLRLTFPGLGDPASISVEVFSDASHASLPSGASQGAYIVFLIGNQRTVPFMWQSKKLNRVTKSPLAAETMALAEAADAGYLASQIVKEAFAVAETPEVKCFTDSRSLIDHLATSHVIQDSRLRVDVARIREMIQLKEVHVEWRSKDEQLADPLTKAGASSAKLLEVLRKAML